MEENLLVGLLKERAFLRFRRQNAGKVMRGTGFSNLSRNAADFVDGGCGGVLDAKTMQIRCKHEDAWASSTKYSPSHIRTPVLSLIQVGSLSHPVRD